MYDSQSWAAELICSRDGNVEVIDTMTLDTKLCRACSGVMLKKDMYTWQCDCCGAILVDF